MKLEDEINCKTADYDGDGVVSVLDAKYTYDVWGNKLAVKDASNNPIPSSTDISNSDFTSKFMGIQSCLCLGNCSKSVCD